MRNRRSKTINIVDKTVIVEEKSVNELMEIYDKNKDMFADLVKANSVDNVFNVFKELLETKISELFPVLNSEDIGNAYPSELEELAGAFIDVNFIGIKKAIVPLIQTTLAGLAKLQPSS